MASPADTNLPIGDLQTAASCQELTFREQDESEHSLNQVRPGDRYLEPEVPDGGYPSGPQRPGLGYPSPQGGYSNRGNGGQRFPGEQGSGQRYPGNAPNNQGKPSSQGFPGQQQGFPGQEGQFSESGRGQQGQSGFPGQEDAGFPGQGDQGQFEEGDYSAIPGEPDKDYPIFSEIPQTSFSCDQQQYPGYYADVEARCQVFHICANNKTYDFLCPNGTIFHQEYLVCVWWNLFDCDSAPSLYDKNANIYDYSMIGTGGRSGGAFGSEYQPQGGEQGYSGQQENTGYEQGPGDYSGGPTQQGYPSGPDGGPQGGYPSGRPTTGGRPQEASPRPGSNGRPQSSPGLQGSQPGYQNGGYPSGKPQRPGYPEQPSEQESSTGYPSGRPQQQGGGYPGRQPQGGQDQFGYPGRETQGQDQFGGRPGQSPQGPNGRPSFTPRPSGQEPNGGNTGYPSLEP
uniref:Glutenin, high molecular weight subunit DX5-like n=1 Tax=Diabrotica virgifera virgifera TaxID=50390 RepID=A0A6P7H9W4_DIAVI